MRVQIHRFPISNCCNKNLDENRQRKRTEQQQNRTEQNRTEQNSISFHFNSISEQHFIINQSNGNSIRWYILSSSGVVAKRGKIENTWYPSQMQSCKQIPECSWTGWSDRVEQIIVPFLPMLPFDLTVFVKENPVKKKF